MNTIAILAVFAPLALMLAWAIFQIIPLSATSALAHPFWSLLPDAGTRQTAVTISVNPSATLAYLVYAIGLLMVAASLYTLGRNSPLAVLRSLAVIITLACAYGIMVFVTGNGSVLWLPKTSYQNSLSGTFINRNSFATLAGLGVLVNLAMLMQRIGEISSRLSIRQRLQAFWLLVLRPNWRWVAMALVCGIALILTSSRAGITASLCGIMVLLGSLAIVRPQVRWPLIGLMLLFIIFTATALGTLSQNPTVNLTSIGEDSFVRQDILTATINLAAQLPYTGSGYGTFETAFPSARTPEMLTTLRATTEHAHNTYLELAAELGYPAAALLGLSAFSLLAACLVGLHTRRRAVIWPALGLAAITLVGGHALQEFSLSIPAVALVAIAIAMLALAQSFPVRDDSSATPPATWQIVTVVVVALAVGAGAAWQSAANYQAMLAQGTVRALVTGNPTGPGPMFVAQAQLMRCLNLNPYHPTCREDLAQVNMSLATGYGLTGARGGVGLVYLNMARQHYLAALAQSPARPLAWYRLARIEAFTGNRPQASTYLANSILTGPAEPVLAYQRIPLMLSLLPEAGPDNRKLFTQNILSVWQTNPWGVAPEILLNPTIQPAFARLLKTLPDGKAQWHRYLKTPFPAT